MILTQKSASVLYARYVMLLTFVCLPHPCSAWLTLNHTGCWLPGFNLSSYFHVLFCFFLLICQKQQYMRIPARGSNQLLLCDVSWYLRAQEQLLSTALNRKSFVKFLLMEGQRVPLSYVHLCVISHQIFFILIVWVCHVDLKLLRTN